MESASISVTVQSITGKRVQLEVDPGIDAHDLRQLVVNRLPNLDPDCLKLVHQGQVLPQKGSVQLKAGSVLVATAIRKVPPQTIRDAVLAPAQPAAAADEEEKFSVPAAAAAWERAVATFLQRKLDCPDLLLEWIFLIQPKNLVMLILAVALAPVAARFDLGPIFIIVCLLVAIFSNLGQRREGDASAYSIFNPGVRRLPGQLDAEQVADEIRQGRM